jgi:anthranilate phosphoribosyltransferase
MPENNTAAAVQPYAVTPLLEQLLRREDLSSAQATELMEAIIAGMVPPVSVAAVAVALRAKSESVTEMAAFATVMRAHAVRLTAPPGTLDTCGTGGDGSRTFNISTATALVAAGLGIPVAKHGGRAASSNSGSADVLKALGVQVEAPLACIERCIREAGVGFMFAPAFHPGMRHVAPVRRELGIRTIFNLLGPLSNPAGARLQLLGVSEPGLCVKFAEVLRDLDCAEAMIVCGAGAADPGSTKCLDEISTFGPTTIARLAQGSVSIERLDPEDVGLPRAGHGALLAADAQQSARIIRGVLEGRPGPARDIVVANAAAALWIAGRSVSLLECVHHAAEAIDSGAARELLVKLVEQTNRA